MTNPLDLIKRLQDKINSNEQVIAFVLVGSQARENVYTATEHSDLEAYIVVKDDAVEKIEGGLPDLVKELGTVLFYFKHAIGFVAVYDDLFRLELPVIKQSDMKSVFTRPKAQIAKILIDKTAGELEQILGKRPEAIDYADFYQEKVINFWYWQIIGVQYFKKGELYNARVVLGIITSGLIKLYEMLNDPAILLLEANKRIEQFLRPEQLEILKQISPAYNSVEIKKGLLDVMEIFPDISKKVGLKYGYNYPQEIEDKVKPRLLNLLKENNVK